jgi:hypothetical protein
MAMAAKRDVSVAAVAADDRPDDRDRGAESAQDAAAAASSRRRELDEIERRLKEMQEELDARRPVDGELPP